MSVKFGKLLPECWAFIGMYLIKVRFIFDKLKGNFEIAIEKLLSILRETEDQAELENAIFWVHSVFTNT
jgi:hypothetical protein